MARQDYGYPFRIDPASRRTALAPTYDAHVEQMIRQVLLTSPGERVDLPEFGCGIRRLLFAPIGESLPTTVQLVVQRALARWLSRQITVQRVSVTVPDAEGSELLVRIDYILKETLAPKTMEVLVQ
jgi:uncharacterized protein